MLSLPDVATLRPCRILAAGAFATVFLLLGVRDAFAIVLHGATLPEDPVLADRAGAAGRARIRACRSGR